MKKFCIAILMCILPLCIEAQEFGVFSFQMLENDLDAITAGTTEKDMNGETAALIKIVTTLTGFTFDAGHTGIVKTKQTPGEIWVYLPRGAKKLTISHPELGRLKNYSFPCAIESARTYEMILVKGKMKAIVKQAKTSQYVVFQFTPKDAEIEINGEKLQATDGVTAKLMPFGEYDYRITASDYFPEAGKLTVRDNDNKQVFTTILKPNFSVVTLKVDNEAEIWVNGDKKDNSTWTGNLKPGSYLFEARLKNHRNTSIKREITLIPDSQTIQLRAPVPIYGKASIRTTPTNADICIDGNKSGQSPRILSQLLVGEHELKISKPGYDDYITTLVINEEQTTKLTPRLVRSKKGQATVAGKPIGDSKSKLSFNIDGIQFTMIRVDAGTFQMGGTKEQKDARDNEKPVHQVTLSTYYIGETEVTNALYYKIAGISRYIEVPQQPATNKTWTECQEFIKKLNEKTGQNFRLPTEAEWEFAARGGKKSRGYQYSGSNNINEVAWYKENTYGIHGSSIGTTIKNVKTKKPNELGIYDMSGNAHEWCQDRYGDYSPEPQTDPTGAYPGAKRVARGGSYAYDAEFCRIAYRMYGSPDTKQDSLGFRLALTLDE